MLPSLPKMQRERDKDVFCPAAELPTILEDKPPGRRERGRDLFGGHGDDTESSFLQ